MPLPVLNEKQAQKQQEKQRLRSLKDMLHQYSAPASPALIERRDNGDVQCFACGHRCLVKPGRDGVCRVRFNDNGTLLVPHGYVGALACDPIEKKPFYHVLPGSDALTFGMLGCDYHCGYCFPGETPVMTTRGPVTLEDAFDGSAHIVRQADGDIAYPLDLQAIAGSGRPRPVRKVFRHAFEGRLTVVRPRDFPEIRCTPDHRVYATTDVATAPVPVRAHRLTPGHLLAIPKRFAHSPHFVELMDSRNRNAAVPVSPAGTLSRAIRMSASDVASLSTSRARSGSAQNEIGLLEADQFYLVPVSEVTSVDFEGDVYNMEVEHEHNYLAGFFLVSNCQNWVTSQMLRDPDAAAAPRLTTPAQFVDLAVKNGAPVVASSYNEPLITSEWAVDVFKEAKGRGLRCAYISNGNGTPRVLDFIRPHVDAYKVDLKTFSDPHYRQLGGVLDNVTDTIRNLKARGFWVEIVTLVVPGFSDDADDLKRMADFLASVDPLMPWHMTAFHPDYKMSEGYRSTTTDDLMKIVELGQRAGLKYLYPGNLAGRVGEWENTRCHQCNATVIRRYGFLVTECRVGPDGLCPDCHKPLPGIWGKPGGHGDGRVRPLL